MIFFFVLCVIKALFWLLCLPGTIFNTLLPLFRPVEKIQFQTEILRDESENIFRNDFQNEKDSDGNSNSKSFLFSPIALSQINVVIRQKGLLVEATGKLYFYTCVTHFLPQSLGRFLPPIDFFFSVIT